ncbi:hypothetical protein BC833DRAFT_582487 [Globomyces pollinis-pini]|nr:hypothetical protein BC833DRAFT_582487 [Globomyces pollinis-pini]
MELLLLVFIIPLIPFYIISTVFSAWIFALGIPFIILTAIVTFLRGFVQAFFSRSVFPTLKRWRARLHHMANTGKWWDDQDDPALELGSQRSAPTLFDRGSKGSQDKAISKSRSQNHGLVSNIVDKLANYGILPSFLLPSTFTKKRNQKSKTRATKSKDSTILSPRENFLDELVLTALQTEPDEPKSVTRHQTSRKQFTNRSEVRSTVSFRPKEYPEPTPSVYSFKTARFGEFAESVTSYHDYQSAHSNHFSLLDELADAADLGISSDVPKETLFDQLVETAICEEEINITPTDSASQFGSDAYDESQHSEYQYDGRADTTDAAKLLFMLGAASKQESPTRSMHHEEPAIIYSR